MGSASPLARERALPCGADERDDGAARPCQRGIGQSWQDELALPRRRSGQQQHDPDAMKGAPTRPHWMWAPTPRRCLSAYFLILHVLGIGDYGRVSTRRSFLAWPVAPPVQV